MSKLWSPTGNSYPELARWSAVLFCSLLAWEILQLQSRFSSNLQSSIRRKKKEVVEVGCGFNYSGLGHFSCGLGLTEVTNFILILYFLVSELNWTRYTPSIIKQLVSFFEVLVLRPQNPPAQSAIEPTNSCGGSFVGITFLLSSNGASRIHKFPIILCCSSVPLFFKPWIYLQEKLLQLQKKVLYKLQ